MKTLLVLRHAKSSWKDSTLDDHERPLNKRGKRDAPRMGELVRTMRLTPDRIISSDAVRARLTAEAVAKAARYTGDIVLDRRLYHAGPADIITRLREIQEADVAIVMIVGHNPGLEELVAHLTDDAPDLPTAALAQIALGIDRWQALALSTRGSLLTLWGPKEL